MSATGARATLRETFGLDLRSLALLRVSLAGMLLVDLAVRAVTLVEHYTDAGATPRRIMQLSYLDHRPGHYSFHMWSGDAGVQWALFLAAAVLALLLLVGFFSRLSLLLSWVLLCSLQNRNFMIETGGDYLLRLTCMWALLLPVGALWSLDAWRRGRGAKTAGAPGPDVSRHHVSVASFAFLIQLSLIYWLGAVHKDHAQWRQEFTAVHYALHIDAYATPFGTWLRQFTGVTRVLTVAVLVFEYVAPYFVYGFGVLSLIPGLGRLRRLQGPVRTAAVFAFMALHSGLGAGLALGTFSWFAVTIWLVVLPGWFWDRLAAACAGRWPGLARLITGPGGAHAADARGHEMGSGPPVPHDAGPGRVVVARLHQAGRVLAGALAAVLLVYTVVINLETTSRRYRRWITGERLALVPDSRRAIQVLRLDQHWGLFAPYPRTVDGWYVLRGTRLDGKQVDLRRDDHRLTWERPQYVSQSYPTFRVRKYFRNLRRKSAKYKRQRSAYTTYMCRAWNAEHAGDERIATLDLIFMGRKTRKGGGHEPPERVPLWHRTCPGVR